MDSRYTVLESQPEDRDVFYVDEPTHEPAVSPFHGAITDEGQEGDETSPALIELWGKDTYCLPISYMMVGAFQGLSSGVMTMFLLSIEATEAQQITIKALRSLPAILKIFFGFLSDSTPIFGYRRKVYMVIGWSISSLSMFGLTQCGTNIGLIGLFYFFFGLGFWMADVISDSIMVEKAKLEKGTAKGRLSAQCYSYRFLLNMITITLVTFAYDYISVHGVFYTLAALPWVVMMPAIYLFAEDRYVAVPSVSAQCREIWTTVCSQAVWQPMAFVYMYQLFQIGNGGWTQYCYTTLHFTALQINSFSVLAYVLLYAGVQVYRGYLMAWNWQLIYVVVAAFSVIISTLQILLLLRVNEALGISSYLFALGDEALNDFLSGLMFLPTILMMTHLCPPGSEGASFAMFTTVNNSAMLLASSFASLLLGVWDVSKAALERGDVSGMIKLTLLTSVLQIFPILFVRLLPRGPEDMKKLVSGSRSAVGGGVFLAVIFVSISWVIITGVLNIVSPGWAGES